MAGVIGLALVLVGVIVALIDAAKRQRQVEEDIAAIRKAMAFQAERITLLDDELFDLTNPEAKAVREAIDYGTHNGHNHRVRGEL